MMDHKVAIEVDASKREELKEFLYKYWPDTIEVYLIDYMYIIVLSLSIDNTWIEIRKRS